MAFVSVCFGVDTAQPRETNRQGAVFELVACPFVLYTDVWRRAYATQARPVFRGRVRRRVAGALIGAQWVDMCGRGLKV